MSNQPCAQCGEIGRVRAGRKFCSAKCAGNARTRPRESACAQCGEAFEPRKGEQRFCSPACRGEYRKDRLTLTCEGCGKAFEVPRSAATRKFCTRSCRDRHTGWRHGTGYGYGQMGCRCDECVAYIRAKGATYRQSAGPATRPPDIEHGTASSYSLWGCRCELCKEARRQRAAAEYWSDPETNSRKSRRNKALTNARTQEKASNSGKRWTSAELEIVATRTDLRIEDLAALLNRSYAAVQCARMRALKDPKWVSAVGATKANSPHRH